MKLKVDQHSDALYLRLDESAIVESQQVAPEIVLDFNGENEVVGIEVLNLSQRSPAINLKELQFQTT